MGRPVPQKHRAVGGHEVAQEPLGRDVLEKRRALRSQELAVDPIFINGYGFLSGFVSLSFFFLILKNTPP